MDRELLSPRNDFVFKKLMGDPSNVDLLADFLQSVLDLPAEEYDTLTVVDPHLSGEHPDDKLGILDVKVATRSGKVIDVEIQVEPLPWMRERILFYAARMVSEQARAGEPYERIQQVASIVITGHKLVADSGRYHHRFRLYDDAGTVLFTDKLEIHTLELPKVPLTPDKTSLWNWLRFFSAEGREDFEMATETSPTIARAYGVLKELSADERTRLLAESREKARRDEEARRKGAWLDGRNEGVEQGIAQGIEKVARNLLRSMDMSRAEVAKATGLTLTEIDRLVGESERPS